MMTQQVDDSILLELDKDKTYTLSLSLDGVLEAIYETSEGFTRVRDGSDDVLSILLGWQLKGKP